MKKLLFFASVLFAGMMISCQQETLEPATGDATVTFTVSVPDVAVKGVTDDGSNINDIVYAVYKTTGTTLEEAQALDNGEPFYQVNETSNASFVGGKSVVSLELINNQNYIILFWAQVSDAWVKGDDFDLTNITYPENMSANNDNLAAFSGVAFVDNVTGGLNKSVELTRPFAQINLATKMPVNYTVELDKSSMTVKGAAQSFNAMTQAASTATTTNVLEFDLAEVPGGEFKTGYQYVGMNYIFVNGNVEVGYTIDTKNHGTGITHTVPDVPVAKNYRTNIIGNLLTSVADYEITLEEEFAGSIDRDPYTFYVTSDGELEEALSKDIKDIVIDLSQIETKSSAPMTYNIDVDANNEDYYIGGEKTRTITINANGNTINFIHHNTDWNYIRCVSDDAKWIINDAALTNSGANDGPWNRHDIRFYNAVELNNVTSDKAIALLNDGKLTNVQISDVHPQISDVDPTKSEAYGLWITAEGQTVSLDGVTITPSEGKTTDRAIKIADQYVDSPAKVTLSVSNSKFVSQKKAAVLVTSPAGALINWGEGNDIKGVAADPINAVWVDEDRAQYASEVKVEGASKVVEGAVENVPASDQAALSAALEQAVNNPETTVVVNVAADTYGTLPALTSNVVLNCAEGTVFEGNSGANINGATVIGATFSNPTGSAVAGTVNGTFKDCVFDGSNGLRGCYAGETVVFENCVFSGDVYGAHFDGGTNDIIFRNCTFSGFNAFGSAVTLITFDGCKFVANGRSAYNGVNLWGATKMLNTEFTFNGTASYEWVDLVGSSDFEYTFNGCTVLGEPMSLETIGAWNGNNVNYETDITFNDVFYENFMSSTFISTAEELVEFAKNVNDNGMSYSGKRVYLVNDIDLAGKDWTPIGQTYGTQFQGTFDGQNYTISNLSVDATADTREYYSSGLFGWLNAAVVKNVKVDGATVKGNHNVGVIGGYLETSGCTIEKCHVTNAAVECHVANSEANGDKCGVIVGHAGNAGVVVNGCTATESTVSAGRDAGQIVGAAKEANVTGCSATNVTVTANGEGNGTNIRNEVIGRIL